MADNVAVTAGTGTTIAADEVTDGTLGTVKVQYVKIMDGTLDGTTKAAVGAAGLKVDLSGTAANSTAIKVDNSAVTQPISAASLPLPTGAATAAKQPALGTAGTASADVITVQGIASMTALKVDGSGVTQPVSGTFWQATQPVSGTVTANQGGTWTVQPGNTANTTPWLTTNTPATSGGYTIYRLLSAATTNGNNIKASAGQVFGWYIVNTSTSLKYVKLYNKATAPTVGTDTPVMTIPIPANTTASGGAGTNVEFMNGIAFATGIGIGVTGAVVDADTTAVAANDVVVNLFYK